MSWADLAFIQSGTIPQPATFGGAWLALVPAVTLDLLFLLTA